MERDASAEMSNIQKRETGPLLSVCIPCFNGAAYLPVVLQALLPQARAAGDIAEVVVVDDASDDDTEQVVKHAEQYGPVRYVRQPTNLGMANNIVSAVSEHSKGEYVWVMSQHNLFRPNALSRVLSALSAMQHLDGFYINFYCANYPEHWPDEAVGGYSGPADYVANADLESHDIERWETLLRPEASMCTQTYAHIIRRNIPVAYWKDRLIGRHYANALDTYTQTTTVAEAMFGKPCYYIGEPVLTIYNGTQTWGSLQTQAQVYFISFPDLLQRYARLGLSKERLRLAQQWGARQSHRILVQIFSDFRCKHSRLVCRYVWQGRRDPCVWRTLWSSFMDAQGCWMTRCLRRVGASLDKIGRYCLCNCRPARWIRTKTERLS